MRLWLGRKIKSPNAVNKKDYSLKLLTPVTDDRLFKRACPTPHAPVLLLVPAHVLDAPDLRRICNVTHLPYSSCTTCFDDEKQTVLEER